MNTMLAPPRARPIGKAQPRPGTTASNSMLIPKLRDARTTWRTSTWVRRAVRSAPISEPMLMTA